MQGRGVVAQARPDQTAGLYPDATLAAQKSKRSSRKRRKAAGAPRAVVSGRREEVAERKAKVARDERVASRQLGTLGERPESPFGGLPISEVAILASLVGLVVWWLAALGTQALVVSLVVCALGVVEVTAREHFSGYRSHTTLLAAIPSLALGIGVLSLVGADRQNRGPLLIGVAGPVFALLVWFLRRRFQTARHERAVRLRR
jgi:hypothetical protein